MTSSVELIFFVWDRRLCSVGTVVQRNQTGCSACCDCPVGSAVAVQ